MGNPYSALNETTIKTDPLVIPSLTPTRPVEKKKTIAAWKPTPKGVGSLKISFACVFLMRIINGFTLKPFSCSMTSWSFSSSLHVKKSAGLGLLSFDLDDTLFPTGEVVQAANEVMISTIHAFGCSDATIELLLDNTRTIRKSLTDPITYRDLRKRAIRKTIVESAEFQKLSKGNTFKGDLLVEESYDAWLNERHAAAERFIFESAVETLQKLRETYPNVCIAAITNGAGDPLAMPNTLAPYFDMRVSGEDEHVFPHRKPHHYIYEYTLQQYNVRSTGEDLIWCHVGDCLANDVAASSSCGAQAIWMCTEADEDSALAKLTDATRVPEWSTASISELETRAKQVIQGRDAVAAKIGKLSELPDAIELILTSTKTRLSLL